MAILKLKNKKDSSIIEIIAFNIDDKQNVLIKRDNDISILKINEFKDMVLGTLNGEPPTYIVVK